MKVGDYRILANFGFEDSTNIVFQIIDQDEKCKEYTIKYTKDVYPSNVSRFFLEVCSFPISPLIAEIFK